MAEDGLVQILVRLSAICETSSWSACFGDSDIRNRLSLCWTQTVVVWPSSTIPLRARTALMFRNFQDVLARMARRRNFGRVSNNRLRLRSEHYA